MRRPSPYSQGAYGLLSEPGNVDLLNICYMQSTIRDIKMNKTSKN